MILQLVFGKAELITAGSRSQRNKVLVYNYWDLFYEDTTSSAQCVCNPSNSVLKIVVFVCRSSKSHDRLRWHQNCKPTGFKRRNLILHSKIRFIRTWRQQEKTPVLEWWGGRVQTVILTSVLLCLPSITVDTITISHDNGSIHKYLCMCMRHICMHAQTCLHTSHF